MVLRVQQVEVCWAAMLHSTRPSTKSAYLFNFSPFNSLNAVGAVKARDGNVLQGIRKLNKNK